MAATAIIKLRRATAAAWTAAGTTVLAAGEIAYETDTRAIKVGDGTTVWTSLPYASSGPKLHASSTARDSAVGTLAAGLDGLIAYLQDSNTFTVYTGAATTWSTIGPAHGAGTAWTPTVTQTVTPSFTTSNSTYSRVGRRILGNGLITLTATTAGTAGVAISLGIPVACAGAGLNLGTATWFDSGNGYWSGNLISTSTALAGIYGSYAVNGAYGATGTTNANGLANLDTIAMQFNYEAGADA